MFDWTVSPLLVDTEAVSSLFCASVLWQATLLIYHCNCVRANLCDKVHEVEFLGQMERQRRAHPIRYMTLEKAVVFSVPHFLVCAKEGCPRWRAVLSTSRVPGIQKLPAGRSLAMKVPLALVTAHKHSVPGSRPPGPAGSQISFCAQLTEQNLKAQVQRSGLTSFVLKWCLSSVLTFSR